MFYDTPRRYVAAMNVPGGGKNDIPNRLKRQFAIFNVPQPSGAAINAIFGALVQARVPACAGNPNPNHAPRMRHDCLEACGADAQGRFSAETCSAEVVAVAGRLVAATQALWARVAPKMLPTPAKFHYLFNMRDISMVGQNCSCIRRGCFNSRYTHVARRCAWKP